MNAMDGIAISIESDMVMATAMDARRQIMVALEACRWSCRCLRGHFASLFILRSAREDVGWNSDVWLPRNSRPFPFRIIQIYNELAIKLWSYRRRLKERVDGRVMAGSKWQIFYVCILWCSISLFSGQNGSKYAPMIRMSHQTASLNPEVCPNKYYPSIENLSE